MTGYASAQDLYAASELIVTQGPDIGWYVVPARNPALGGQWVAWDDADPGDPGHTVCPTRAQAVACHMAGAVDVPGTHIAVRE